MRLLIISPTAYPPAAERMLATARKFGLEPLLYGLTSNHPHGKDYQGTDIVNILTERTDAEYVMGVDAPDVAFLTGEDEIMEKLSKFQHPFVVSAENDGVRGIEKTQEELARQCVAAGGHHAQLNIGGWIGRRDYALHVLNEAERLYKDKPENPAYSYDNHFQFLALMKAWGGGPEFHVDMFCEIFQSMNKTDVVREDVDGRIRIRNLATRTLPAVVHYNGDKTLFAYDDLVRRIL